MNYNKKTVLDVDVSGKKVLLRCDFNVPQDKETGEITSDADRGEVEKVPRQADACARRQAPVRAFGQGCHLRARRRR